MCPPKGAAETALMRTRRLIACGLVLLTATTVAAQAPERPTELPPLLRAPPAAQPTPAAPVPRGPVSEYDPGYLYLPERAPVAASTEPACGPAGRFWFVPTLELGWTRAAGNPLIARTGVVVPGGVIPGTVVYGGRSLAAPGRAGFGLGTGMWFDPQHTRGIDASFYYLGKGTTETAIFAGNIPMLLPVHDPLGTPAFFALAGPDVGIGAYQVGLSTRYASADVNYRQNLLCYGRLRIDGLVGYRYAHLGEDLQAYGKRLGPTGEIIRFKDHVDAANHFHGAQIGLAVEHQFGQWYVAFAKKLAFGGTVTTTDFDGAFRVNGTVDPYGFYSRPAVAGRRSHTDFAVMPVLTLMVGRQLWDHGRVFAGYTLQSLTAVTRATDVVDGSPTLAGYGTGMQRETATSSFWSQSVTLGMDLRY